MCLFPPERSHHYTHCTGETTETQTHPEPRSWVRRAEISLSMQKKRPAWDVWVEVGATPSHNSDLDRKGYNSAGSSWTPPQPQGLWELHLVLAKAADCSMGWENRLGLHGPQGRASSMCGLCMCHACMPCTCAICAMRMCAMCVWVLCACAVCVPFVCVQFACAICVPHSRVPVCHAPLCACVLS